MAENYHSKICAIAHNAMAQLFAAGLVEPDRMRELDVLCRTDVNLDEYFAAMKAEAAQVEQEAADLPNYAAAPYPSTPALDDFDDAPIFSGSAASWADPAPAPYSAAAPMARAPAPVFAASSAARPLRAAIPPIAANAAARRPATMPIYGAAATAFALPAEDDPPPPVRRAAAQRSRAAPTSSAVSTAGATATQTGPAASAPQDGPSAAVARSAANLRALREREGVSEAVFARCLKVMPQTVIAWEAGRLQPSAMTLSLLAMVEEKGLNAIS
jgi:DNA-binding transcriptional regulator YiaG